MRKREYTIVVVATTEREGKLDVSSLGEEERARGLGPFAGRFL